VGSGAAERVVAIHSFVEDGCAGKGYGGRVATAGAAFFASALAKPLPSPSCGLCSKVALSGTNECARSTAACLADPDCKGWNDCLAANKPVDECAKEFPFGEGPYRMAASCTCTHACADACAGDAKCEHVPKCGLKLRGDACDACVEASCCDAAAECAADGHCYACLRADDLDPMCTANAARAKLAQCIDQQCGAACASNAPGATGAMGAAGASQASPASSPAEANETEAPGDEGRADVGRARAEGCAAAPLHSRAASASTEAALVALAALARRRRRR
jgi:hypothetical protein